MLAILKTALRAIRRNVMRSFLTMLGIIVGIAAVIVGVSMGTGAKAEVERQIASMGNNLVIIFSGNMSRGGVRGGFGMQPNLTERDYDTLRREVTGLAGISPEVRATVLEQLNSEHCTCGCGLTLAQCRIDDPSCTISLPLAQALVKKVASQ